MKMIRVISLVLFMSFTILNVHCITEHLDKYIGTPKYGYSRNLVFSIGYDNIHDSRYEEQEKIGLEYVDLIDKEYARSNFQDSRITFLNNAVENENLTKSKYSFSAAQRSLSLDGTYSDRWDVRVNDREHQFFGLYYGNDTFVTNRMRAHGLLWLINGINDYLKIFDDDSLTDDRFIMEKELKEKIKSIIESLAGRIKQSKFSSNDFENYIPSVTVGGSLVCVSDNYLVVILMGGSNVIIYDEDGNRLNLMKEHESQLLSSYFLSRSYKVGSPYVAIIPRKYQDSLGERKIKYVILESESLGRLVTEETLDDLLKIGQTNLGESVLIKILTEDVIQKAVQTWSAQDMHFKNEVQDISLIITSL